MVELSFFMCSLTSVKKVISILLILLILLPSIGLSIGMHKCGGDIKVHKLVFDSAALQCEMQTIPNKSSCPAHPEQQPSDANNAMDCCDDILVSIETDHYQLTKSLSSIHNTSSVLFDIASYTLTDQFNASQRFVDNNLSRSLRFPPPDKTIFIGSQVLFQSFLN